MNPKISYLGMARMFGVDDEIEGNTRRVRLHGSRICYGQDLFHNQMFLASEKSCLRLQCSYSFSTCKHKGRTQCTRLPLYAGSGRSECRLALPPFMERLLPSLEPETYHSWANALAITPSWAVVESRERVEADGSLVQRFMQR
ncbi:hypothetical protein DVH24_023869 [Malus domestica]|uniref:Uncharacterized protein n=1 Tax=Malus domestica TaxID=3750 RepID=A0A498JH21_MALDO|nr:hypothetical protein DVH24_023869 [Malus domestica]